MGRVEWFRSKGFLMLLHYAKALVTAAWGVATQYIGNHRQEKKGGGTSRKKSERKK